MSDKITNVVVAGLGGQGVITASDMIVDAAFAAGLDVKKSEIKGMSQRGGSVNSDVRFGRRVLSPMVPAGEADVLVVVSPDQVENNRYVLRPGGVLIEPSWIEGVTLPHARSMNVALIGALSAFTTIDAVYWEQAVRLNLAERLHEANLKAFALGRETARKRKTQAVSSRTE